MRNRELKIENYRFPLPHGVRGLLDCRAASDRSALARSVAAAGAWENLEFWAGGGLEVLDLQFVVGRGDGDR
jgi:hypothetical protein